MSTFSIAEPKNYFPFIDGLRGIAILMVIAVHTGLNVGIFNNGTIHPYLESLVSAGARGVQLFFMVSAFTLFSSSFRRFNVDKFPKISFYIRRAFRILPFWWLMVLVFGFATQGKQVLPSLLFYFGFIRFDIATDVVPGGWSLFVEECFYVLLPFIFLHITNIKRASYFVVICLIINTLWQYFSFKFGVPDSNYYIGFFPLAHWYCFAIGIFIFFLINNDKFKSYTWSRWTLLVFDLGTFTSLGVLIIRPFVPATFALALFFITSSNHRTLCGKIVRNPLLMRYGGYCYSIYLFHYGLISILSPLKSYVFANFGLNYLPLEVGFLIYFILIAAIALGLGYVSFNLIEKPCVKLGKLLICKIEGGPLLSIKRDVAVEIIE